MTSAPRRVPLDTWGEVTGHDRIKRVRIERATRGGFLVLTVEVGGEYDVWIESDDEVERFVATLNVRWP